MTVPGRRFADSLDLTLGEIPRDALIRARAPLRISFGGGGTDLLPYAFPGAVQGDVEQIGHDSDRRFCAPRGDRRGPMDARVGARPCASRKDRDLSGGSRRSPTWVSRRP